MKKISMSLGLAALILGGSSITSQVHAQLTQAAGGYSMKMKFTPGSVMKYNVSTSATNPSGKGQNFSMNMPMTLKVKSVSNGVATMEATVDMSSVSKGAKPQVSTYKIDSYGNVVGQAGGMGNMGSASLPKGVVKIGQSWKQAMNNMGMQMNATYTFKGVKKVGAHNCAEIGVTMSGGGNTGGANTKSTGTGTIYMRAADMSLHGANINMSMSQGAQKMGMTMKMTRTQ